MSFSSRFPLWFRLIYFGVELRRLTVPAVLTLLLIGWLDASWLGGLRSSKRSQAIPRMRRHRAKIHACLLS